MVALFNLCVFKCLQDVHANFMNPSVFVTEPSAKGKINFPRETDTHRERLTNFLSLFSWSNCYRGNRTCTPNSGLFILKRNSAVSPVSPASIYYPFLATLRLPPWWFATLPCRQKCRRVLCCLCVTIWPRVFHTLEVPQGRAT